MWPSGSARKTSYVAAGIFYKESDKTHKKSHWELQGDKIRKRRTKKKEERKMKRRRREKEMRRK